MWGGLPSGQAFSLDTHEKQQEDMPCACLCASEGGLPSSELINLPRLKRLLQEQARTHFVVLCEIAAPDNEQLQQLSRIQNELTGQQMIALTCCACAVFSYLRLHELLSSSAEAC